MAGAAIREARQGYTLLLDYPDGDRRLAGPQRIAFVGAHADREPASLRLRGYQEALGAAGLPLRPELVATTASFDRADGMAGMRALLALEEPPDAVFAYNDLIAIGVVRARSASAAEDGGRRRGGQRAIGRISTPLWSACTSRRCSASFATSSMSAASTR